MINFFIWDNGEQVALRILEEIFTTRISFTWSQDSMVFGRKNVIIVNKERRLRSGSILNI